MANTKILYTREQIVRRISELAKEIASDYKGEKVVMIGILKGSFVFFADLIRELYWVGLTDVVVDFMTISAYGAGTTHSGQTHVLADITRDILDKHVIVVEDIVDSGHTLTFVKKYLLAKKPKSLKFAVFLDKIERREVEFTLTLSHKGRGVSGRVVHAIFGCWLRISLLIIFPSLSNL
ncbi:MAG: hypoxanthine phosphoribosyltransferase [Candidatus Levybacteria bacterium]|nr:hypoxanthine phosphoribosyltransferase [Candidatus Levybacteria bacterium]